MPPMKTTAKNFAFLNWVLDIFSAILVSALTSLLISPAQAAPITTATDGTGTVVNLNGNQFNVTGGTLSGDGGNLFHSFQQFGLDANQVANFLSNPQINNILGRVVGGDPSVINGLIQVTGGNSNLYLMNPAGIVFGSGASLNVPGDFTATTANALGFGNDNWFESGGSNDYQNLVGNPNQFAFDSSQPGAIINAGDLGVNQGKDISLVAGQVINTGTVTAPGGEILIAAVPGSSKVTISKPGNILSLEIEPPRDGAGNILPIKATDLPELLTGKAQDVDTGVKVDNAGKVKLTENNLEIPDETATAIVSGHLNVVSQEQGENPGQVSIVGDKVGVVEADIDASGSNGGGTIWVGGNYQGGGAIPNAQRTYVDSESSLKADATEAGDGGEVIVWADKVTAFYGEVSSRGGETAGNGGFVEISGKDSLAFDGEVDVTAPLGEDGTILFDPENIEIVETDPTSNGQLDAGTPDGDPEGQILAGHGGVNQTFAISNAKLESLTGNIILQATNKITVNAAVSFQAGIDITLTSDDIDINQNISGDGKLHFRPHSKDRHMDIGGTGTTGNYVLSSDDLNNIQDGFNKIQIGRGDGTGIITLGEVEFNDPVEIVGGTQIQGPNRATTYTITGENAGNVSGFGETVSFKKIADLQGGDNVDIFTVQTNGEIRTINGGVGSDIFNLAGTVTGNVDGGGSNDTFNIQAGSHLQDVIGNGGKDTFNYEGGTVANLIGDGDNIDELQIRDDEFNIKTETIDITSIDGGGSLASSGDKGDKLSFGELTSEVSWIIDNDKGGEVEGISFTNIENLDGSQGKDDFTLKNDGKVNDISASTGNDVFKLDTGSEVNNILAGGGDDTFQLNGGIVTGRLEGGDKGNDKIEIVGVNTSTYEWKIDPASDNSVSKKEGDSIIQTTVFNDIENVSGSAGNDTLTGSNAELTWTINGDKKGSVQGQNQDNQVETTNFEKIENLQGGNQVDIFNFEGNSTITSVNGGEGDDKFDIANDSTVNVSERIYGNVGSDTFNLAGTVTGNVDGGESNDKFNFEGNSTITSVNGGEGDDKFDIANDSTVNVSERIYGNVGSDTFNLAGTVTGNVDGGGSNDTFNIQDGSDLQNVIGNGGKDTFNYEGGTVKNLIGDGVNGNAPEQGDAREDTFNIKTETVKITSINGGGILTSNCSSSCDKGDKLNLGELNNKISWTITGDKTGKVEGLNNNVTLNFTNIEDLNGSQGNDNFDIQGKIRTINSGEGDDKFQLNGGNVTSRLEGGKNGNDTIEILDADVSNTYEWKIDPAGDNSVSKKESDSIIQTTVFDGIENVIGSAGTDTLTGSDAELTWTINGDKKGSVQGQNQDNPVETTNFEKIENLQGGNQIDTFNFEGNSTITSVNGGEGNDQFDVKSGSMVTINVGGNIDGGRGNDQFDFAGKVTGNIQGNQGNDEFNIKDGSNLTSVFGSGGEDMFTFEGNSTIVKIVSGNNKDTFNIKSGSTVTVSERIDGGRGDDQFDFAGKVTGGVIEGDRGNDTFNINSGSNLQNVIGDNDDSNDNNDQTQIYNDTFNVNSGSIVGNINGKVGDDIFKIATGSKVTNINGGSGNDNLELAGEVTGSVYGDAGNDTFNINNGSDLQDVLGNNGDDTFNLTNAKAVNVIGNKGNDTFNINNGSNLQNVIGDNDDSNDNNDQNATYNDTFNVNSGSMVGNINGKVGNDIFNLTAGNVANVKGDSGEDTFQLGIIGTGANEINISGTIDGGANTDILFGSDTTSANGESTWNIASSSSGDVDGIPFTNIENLEGGADNDTFVFADGVTFFGEVNGNAGTEDTLDYTNFSTPVDINLDQLKARQIEIVRGPQDKPGSIFGSDENSIYTITGKNTGNVERESNGKIETFIGIAVIQAGTGDDTFVFEEGGSLFDDLLDKPGRVDGGGGNGRDRIEIYTGFDNDWRVSNIDVSAVPNMTNDGSYSGSVTSYTKDTNFNPASEQRSVSFNNVEELVGGNYRDDFRLTSTAAASSLNKFGEIDGGTGDNTLFATSVNNEWALDVQNKFSQLVSEQGQTEFRRIQNIFGGSANDNFAFKDGVDLDNFETIDGGAAITRDTANYSAHTNTVTVFLQELESRNIERAVGSNTQKGSLVNRNLDSIWRIDGANQGSVDYEPVTLNPDFTFENFDILKGGNQIDNFILQGNGKVTRIEGGAGQNRLQGHNLDNTWQLTPSDKLDYLKNSLGRIDFQDIQTISGGSQTDNLIASSGENDWQITGSNSGSVTSLTNNRLVNFGSIESLTGRNAQDTFTFSPNAFFNGAIEGGGGNQDILDYSQYGATIIARILNEQNELRIKTSSNSTLTANATNIENIIGSDLIGDRLLGADINNQWQLTGIHQGRINGLNFSQFERLIGGSQTDTLTGADVPNQWIISDLNKGRILGNVAFREIENFTGGNSDDTFVFSASSADITGDIAGGNGNLTLIGDEMTWGEVVSGTGELFIQTLSSVQNINIGGAEDTTSLDLTTTKLESLQDGFSRITIGKDDQATINIVGDSTFQDSLTLLADTINGQEQNITGEGEIRFQAQGNITVGDIINSGSPITLTSNKGNITTKLLDTSSEQSSGGAVFLTTNLGAITTGDILTFSQSNSNNNGGNVTIEASNSKSESIALDLNNEIVAIKTGEIDTHGNTGGGGEVLLNAIGNIEVVTINTEGGSNGNGGKIDITAGPYFRATGTFMSLDGLVASISAASGKLDPINITGGEITIRHAGQGLVSFDVGVAFSKNGTLGAITNGNFSINPTQSFLTAKEEGNILISPDRFAVNNFNYSAVAPQSLTQDISNSSEEEGNELEEGFTSVFEKHLGIDVEPITLTEAKAALDNIEQTIGVRTALIYTIFKPVWQYPQEDSLNIESFRGRDGKPNLEDELTLVVVTANGELLEHKVEGATWEEVNKTVKRLRRSITNPERNAYLKHSQQLYDWLVRPVEEHLQQQDIDNIAFLMDMGLRSVPVAAMHDGENFILENYSVGIMPSLSLTNRDYGNVKGTSVLGLGASQFEEKSPLAAVPLELSLITENLWSGQSFLNERFTRKNLKTNRRSENKQFNIVHLATHAEFRSGKPEDSYIQLWNDKLPLSELPSLGWDNPQVEMLVLSACRTALGDVEAELGFAGAAALAGVKSVLGSLWTVDDEGTLALMTSFYEELANQEYSVKAEAIRTAQLNMLRGQVTIEDGQLITPHQTIPLPQELGSLTDKDLSHPYYWSAFTVIGNPW